MRTYIVLFFLFCVACKSGQVHTITSGGLAAEPAVPEAPAAVQPKEEEKEIPATSHRTKKKYDLDTKIGQMILVGINDRTSLSANDPIRQEIAAGKTGGIILFEKNIAATNSKETLRKLVAELQSEAKELPLFMSIDEEGGLVHRLKEKYGFVKMPSAAYLGKLNNLDSTYHYNRVLAQTMAALGINLNFAPDIDLALNPSNPVIAKVGRSYSANHEQVSLHALAAIKAHHREQVKTAIKHFPGHGSSTTDSHFGMTDVTKQWKLIELLPYYEIIQSGHCDAIMTAHIVNCNLDTACLPATLSKTILTDLLRNVLSFDGVVFTDDMQMHAISKYYGLEKAIKMSILAGADVLVFGNNVNASDRIKPSEIHAIIKKLVTNGDIPEQRIEESFRRITTLKEKKF
jgi:beta-N-acetylhexosaminidase